MRNSKRLQEQRRIVANLDGLSERVNELQRVLIVHASQGGGLERQVEKWKSENIDIEFLAERR